MTDKAMCMDGECPSKEKCYRYMAKPSDWQSYANFQRDPKKAKCDAFLELFKKKNHPTKENKI